MSEFLKRLWKMSKENKSRIVLALDPSAKLTVSNESDKDRLREELVETALRVIHETRDHIAAIKINRQLILPLGLFDRLQKIIKVAKSFKLPLIVDCKINDVGHTNLWIAQHYFDAGFDAVIANPFVGWEGGLDSVFELAHGNGKGVILLVYMSHPASREGYGQSIYDPYSGQKTPQYLAFAKKAAKWKADGVVCGATFPDKIRDVYNVLGGEIPIFSPGIGAQGGAIKEAFNAGTSFAIVGRSIYQAENPKNTVLSFKRLINQFLKDQ
ncbi:MAG: orotidine 5'-phosphate decarboxylase / HUMPS family protein [Candidatus Hodarchaeota archaeon]